MLKITKRKNYFKFKQFTIFQTNMVMKVGTDGVLLGAWVNCSEATNILDIGTGTGLIAIMLAQRSNAKITGIDILENVCKLALKNVENCKWKTRINIKNISFQEFATKKTEKFDLIITNPPFFTNLLKPDNYNLKIAKHNDLLPFNELIENVNKVLSKNGKFCLIIPIENSDSFIKLCEKNELYCTKKMFVKPNHSKKPKRILMEFQKNKTKLISENFTIETSERHKYTTEYKKLTEDFYL